MIRNMRTYRIAESRAGTAIIIAILSLTAVPAVAKIKCWTNQDGIRECGNAVPPEFAQKGHEELSSGGVTLESTGRAKSLDEVEAERAASRAQVENAERMREQAAKDKVLLDTFSSEDDMVLARDGQLSHLESQVKLTESHIEKLQKSLGGLIQKAADHERRGKEPPKKLIRDINSLRNQIADNATFIDAKRIERVEMLKKFESDLSRFRELKGGQVTSTGGGGL